MEGRTIGNRIGTILATTLPGAAYYLIEDPRVLILVPAGFGLYEGIQFLVESLNGE